MIKRKLIDVSYAQGVIDWEKVKPHIDGAIIRCGYGMDSETQDDEYFKRNADACTRLGIPFGVYIYSHADSVERIKSEAAHVLRLIKGYQLSYPVYLDLEENNTRSGAVERARVFGDIIEGAGYWCGIYANLNWWNNYLKGLDRFTKWVAHWGVSECQYKGSNLDMWQYSEKGQIPGISGNVDMNVCYRDFPAEIGQPAQPETDAVDNTVTVTLDILQFGSQGAEVKALQILLMGNACPCGKWGADGKFGVATENAIKQYQQKKKLPVTGKADPETWASLLGIS
jgi:GH25 family lysozyme M1 (1,4-beta-N-acetylmuramidase)